MKIFKILFLVFAVSVFGQNVAQNFDFPKIKSSITVPVEIPLSEIANMANASVGDLIFQDDSYSDNDNDQFKIKVWKLRPIRIVGGTQQNLLIEVPLKIWAEKGIGTLGVYSYQNTTFETVMYFNTSILFNNNWTITTTTKPNSYKWITKPVLDFGTIKIPITPIVEKKLVAEQAKFCKTMDKQLSTQLNFQKYALMAWNLFNEPFQVSEDYNTWLKVTPLSVNISPLKFYRDEIDLNIGIDTYSETFTGQKPIATPKILQVTNFNYVQNLPNDFLLQTTANIPFSEATNIAQKMFLNKEFDFREGKSKIKITDIKVYSEAERVMIEAQTEGSVNGISYISGIPVYDVVKRKIVLTDTKFRLKTSNILQKTLTLLFQGKIVKMIEDEYGIPTAEMEDSSRKSTEETFNKEFYTGLKMSGRVIKMQPSKVFVNPDFMTVVVDMNASLKVLVKGMKL